MAIDYCEPILSDDYAKSIGREDWIGTRCVRVGEGHEMYKAFLAGYNAAAPKWISVKDRLPEIGEWVLINGPEVCQRIEPPSASWKAEYAWNTDHETFYYPKDITHWMPLPTPPKEKE